MSENTMPAAEAADGVNEQELVSYELAFHVLPTVAEGEVTSVVDALKTKISKAKGEVTDEEVPQRFDLAYEIVKSLEGKNRSFKSAYFGWIRFQIDPAQLAIVADGVEDEKSLLRHLLIRLTKVEEEHPFYFHEALATEQVTTIDGEQATEEDGADDEASEEDTNPEDTGIDEAAEAHDDNSSDAVEGGVAPQTAPQSIDEAELDEALKKAEA